MERRLIAAIRELTPAQRARIADAAAARGFTARFFDSEADALAEAAEAEIFFGDSPAMAARAPKLRWLCTPSAGANQYPPGAFLSPEAVLTNSSGAYGVTIAEHIVMVTLELMRRQGDYADIVARRDWTRNLPVTAIRGCRCTLLGAGDIGREAAKRLRAFGPARIDAVSRSGRDPEGAFDSITTLSGLDALLPGTQLLILSLPATEETAKLMDERRLSLLPEGAIVVNVGRGSTLDQAALEGMLRSGRLRAALDVFEQEPIPRDASLWDCPNLIITPHVAGNMTLPYTVERIVALFLENFERYCAEERMMRVVDLKRGY